jgi:hypothetical protein
MRVESSVTSITWIPSEAISGMPKMPFEMGIAHYDEPPPDRIDDLEALHENDLFREANELKAWIEVDDGEIVDQGYSGEGRIGVTRIKLGSREIAFAAVQYPLLQAEPEIGDGWVKFVQSAGGHMGLPAPRRVRGKPFMRIKSASAWTTLQLIIYADGTSKHSLIGASPFPRHWIYDKDGQLVEKSGTVDFEKWYRESHGANTPWGDEDSPALVTAVESELERELSASIMRSGVELERRQLNQGDALVQQGDEGRELFLLLDGLIDVEVNGEEVAEIGPGAFLGERALLEGGKRTATLWATTDARVVVIPPEAIEESAMTELAASHQRENG